MYYSVPGTAVWLCRLRSAVCGMHGCFRCMPLVKRLQKVQSTCCKLLKWALISPQVCVGVGCLVWFGAWQMQKWLIWKSWLTHVPAVRWYCTARCCHHNSSWCTHIVRVHVGRCCGMSVWPYLGTLQQLVTATTNVRRQGSDWFQDTGGYYFYWIMWIGMVRLPCIGNHLYAINGFR